MKRSNCFFLRKVGDTYFLQCSDFYEQKMVFLNETGMFLWEHMPECDTKEDLVNVLIESYDVQRGTAEEDVQGFLDFLFENKCLTNEE